MALISLECCSTLASFNHFFLENPQVTKASLDKQNKAKMKLHESVSLHHKICLKL